MLVNYSLSLHVCTEHDIYLSPPINLSVNLCRAAAFVKKMMQDPVTGEPKAQVAARLTKGHSFGVLHFSVFTSHLPDSQLIETRFIFWSLGLLILNITYSVRVYRLSWFDGFEN